jgi:hypothetical protein
VKRLYVAVGALLAIVLFAEVALLLVNLRTRHRAESLLASLRMLKLGQSTFEDVQPMLAAYKAQRIRSSSNCPSADSAYGIVIANHVINRIEFDHPQLLRLGLRPVGVSATLSFVGARLCEFRYEVSVLLPGGQYPSKDSMLNSVEVIELRAQSALQLFDNPVSSDHYGIFYFDTLLRGTRWPGRTLGMTVTVTPSAPLLDLQRAFAFDLSCFTSLRGCRAFCQIMPLASQDALERHKTEGLHIPEEETKYQGCSKVFGGTG